jgi:hypothetical protein
MVRMVRMPGGDPDTAVGAGVNDEVKAGKTPEAWVKNPARNR